MKSQKTTCRCPVCGQWYTGNLPVHEVKIWKNLIKDQHITVLQARCRRCGSVFEAGTTKTAVMGFRGSPYLLLLATVTLLASLMDGFLSLQLFQQGAIELNPLLSAILAKSPIHFFITKYLLTSFGVIVLVLFSERRFLTKSLTGRHLLVASQAMFAAMIAYQSTLIN